MTLRTNLSALGFLAVAATSLAHCGGSSVGIPLDSGDASADGAGGTDGGGGADASGKDAQGGDAGTCPAPGCDRGRTCCGRSCVNTNNDPFNCGECGKRCTGDTPVCSSGKCEAANCGIVPCPGVGDTCCGGSCCRPGQLCCDDEGPVGGRFVCHTPTDREPTCPQGCAPLCQSDRHAKRDIAPVDPKSILNRVAALPMSTWSYKTDASGTRHLGPMAQDFHHAFGLGSTDRAYDAVDAHGIALASIQALYQLTQEQERRLRALEEENARLRKGARR